MNRLVFSSLVSLALSLTATDGASQVLYSRSLSYPGGRLLLALSLEGAQPASAYTVAVTGNRTLAVRAPANVATDARGFSRILVDLNATQPNTTPENIQITISGPGLPPPGMLQRSFLLECAGGEIFSAWPDFIQLQGAFCNPASSAANHLQIDRRLDLDGDGFYGDINIEGVSGVPDRLDHPSELSCDVNACSTGAGIYQPGSARRTVAWATDNRQVNTCSGSCSFTTAFNRLSDGCFAPAFNGPPAVFFTTSGGGSTQSVIILRDSDGDGQITAPEVNTFFDPKAIINNETYSPDGVAWDPTASGRLFWISDGTSNNDGLYLLEDSGGGPSGAPNDQIEAGELIRSWTPTTSAVQVESQTIAPDDFEGLHVDHQGAVLLNHATLGTIFRWVDANANGVAETGEVTNWLTYDSSSSLSVNAEFASTSSGFPSFVGQSKRMNLIQSVAAMATGGRDLVFVASDEFGTPATRGWVFRCDDQNGDGDVNDSGEVTIFIHGANVLDPVGFPPLNISGMDAATVDVDGSGTIDDAEIFVYIASPSGPPPTTGFTFSDLNTWRFHDIDGDGTAMNVNGEGLRVAIHPTGAFNNGLELVPGPQAGGFARGFYNRSSLTAILPATCTTSSGTYISVDFSRDKLEVGTQGTPFVGNQRFEFRMDGNTPGATPSAGLFLGVAIPPIPLPGGCQLGLDLGFNVSLPLGSLALPDAAGTVIIPFAIPDLGELIGATVWVQGFNVDFTLPALFVLGEVAEVRLY